MTHLTSTFLDYLRTTNPDLDCTGCRSGPAKSTQGRFLYKSPKIIHPWTDFEFRTLTEMYSGSFNRILETRHDLQDYSDIAEMPYRRISDEASLESFLDIWNWRTVSKALAIAQKGENRSPDHHQIFMAKGGQGRFPEMAVVRNGRRLKPLKPDWAGIKQPPDSHEQPPNILPGDTKLSCKWHSSRIQSGTVAEMGDIDNWLPAIRQIYTYCIKANAQYGYLITDQELLAVKISWLVGAGKKVPRASREEEAERRQRNGTLEFKAIPWE
ncbi:MAG: hypothetical protein L6R42_005135 [Xanthoria sp. 1 TBL-2021]|nr:MAG: hypothetical protein L6R42_005135 [Xanthoria sp. 1 TBL-2021]